jgi:hypothetical protein
MLSTTQVASCHALIVLMVILGYEYVKEKFGVFQRSTVGSAKGQTRADDDTMSTFVNAFVSGALTDLAAMVSLH